MSDTSTSRRPTTSPEAPSFARRAQQIDEYSQQNVDDIMLGDVEQDEVSRLADAAGTDR